MKELLVILCLLIILTNSTMQLMLMIYIIKDLKAKKDTKKKETERIEKEREKNIATRIHDVRDEILEKVESVIATTLTKEFAKKEADEIRELNKYIEQQKKKNEKIIAESMIKEVSPKEIKKENEENDKAIRMPVVSQDTRIVGNYFNREIAIYLNEINQSINKAEYGKYIDVGWKDIGTGDGRSILAENGKIKYGKGNVKIKEMEAKPERYMAIPGKTQWMGKELCSDAMKECYSVKDIIENARYKIVRLQSPGILQRKGEEFIVVQKGTVEINWIG